MRFVIIVLVERVLGVQVNDLHFWKTTYIYKDNGIIYA